MLITPLQEWIPGMLPVSCARPMSAYMTARYTGDAWRCVDCGHNKANTLIENNVGI